jgi:hypothetical protein
LSRNWAMPVGGGGRHGAEQREGAGEDCAMVKCGRSCRAHIVAQRPSQDSGLLTPCSPVQYRHAVNMPSTYRWRIHRHAASLFSLPLSNILLRRVAGPPANRCQRPYTQQMRCDVFGDGRAFVWRRHKRLVLCASAVQCQLLILT